MKNEDWHYCHECQIERGGKVPAHGQDGITVMQGTCSKCKREDVILVPNNDYDWPDRRAWFD